MTAEVIDTTDDQLYYALSLCMQRNYLDVDNMVKPEVRATLVKWLPKSLIESMGEDFCIARVKKRWEQHTGLTRRTALDMYLAYVSSLSGYGVHSLECKDESDKVRQRVAVIMKGLRVYHDDDDRPRYWFPW